MYRFYSKENPRVSVVGEYKDGVLRLAASICSLKDQFIRKKGRTIAEGRLAKGKMYKLIPMTDCNSVTFLHYAKKTVEELQISKIPC